MVPGPDPGSGLTVQKGPALERGWALPLAVVAIVALAGDAAGRLVTLPWPVVALLATAALAALVHIVIRGRIRRNVPLVIALLGVALLAGNALGRAGRLASIEAQGEALTDAEVHRVADRVQDEARALAGTAAAAIDQAAAILYETPAAGSAGEEQDGEEPDVFGLLERAQRVSGFTGSGRGLSLYDRRGTLVAWSGTSFPAPEGLLDNLPADAAAHRVAVEPQVTRLYAVRAIGDGDAALPGAILVAEITIESLLDPVPLALALPSLPKDAPLRMQDFRADSDQLDAMFQDRGDRYEGSALGRRSLFAALRASSGEYLGHVRLQRVQIAEMIERASTPHRHAAAAIIAALTFGLTSALSLPGARRRRGTPGEIARLARVVATIWIGRTILAWFTLRLPIRGNDLFDAASFASTRFGNLLRSPGDFALTTIAVLTTAVIIHRTCGGVRPDASVTPSPMKQGAGLLILLAAALAAVFVVPAVAGDLVQNATVDVLALDLPRITLPGLTLQVSSLLLLLALFLLFSAGFMLAAPGAGVAAAVAATIPRPVDRLSRWTLNALLPGMILAALLFGPLLQPHQRRVTESIVEDVLMTEVTGRHTQRMARLRETIQALSAMPDLGDRLVSTPPGSVALALDAWRRTPLDRSEDDASLIFESPEGFLISRFGRNFPPALDRAERHGVERVCDPGVEVIPFHDVSKSIIHGCLEVSLEGQIVGIVTVHILDDIDAPLGPATPYSMALAPRGQRLLQLPAHVSVRLTVYTNDGTERDPENPAAPALPASWDGERLWVTSAEANISVRTLFFMDDMKNTFGITYQLPTPAARLAGAVRATILALAVLVAILIPPALVRTRGHIQNAWPLILDGIGRTHYRKILATFAATTLVPLLALSLLMTEYIRTAIQKDVEGKGRQAILTSLKLARSIEIQEFILNDDIAYWLSELIGEDVNLYRGDEILATSRRELFDSGLLSPRLDGQVYGRLVPGGEPFAIARQTLRGITYWTITAVLPGGAGQVPTLLSLPLEAETDEAQDRAQEIADAMLITSCGMILLMGSVGYIFARRVSRPVRNLSAAAARIAAGDLDAAVADRPRDEMGGLIRSFNSMAVALKQQRQDLEDRRDYIEKILSNATIGVISMDRTGTVVTCNPAARTILGRRDIVTGTPLLSLLTGHAWTPLVNALHDPETSSTRDLQIPLPGGPVDRTVRARVVSFLEGEGLILLLEDVTEAVRSNRLEAWAEMARRIAHEIKNPLTPIQLSAEHIRRVHREGLSDFDRVLEECLHTIMNEVAKLRQISREFSTYARIPTPLREPAPMSDLIMDAVRPYRMLPPGLDLEVDVQPDLPVLEVDRSLLSRAIVNLIENAIQAMPRGGRLTVRARALDGRLSVEIEDTGMGMSAQDVTRIFEPYFSTKDSGTGLGLPIARKAIEEHGGSIEVSSRQGIGTTMRVVLPLGQREGGPASAAVRAPGWARERGKP